jgi:hypothetical protein
MSYASRGPRRPEDLRKEALQRGSVRAARERLERSQFSGGNNAKGAATLASHYSSIRSPPLPISPTSTYSVALESGEKSPQWPLPRTSGGKAAQPGIPQSREFYQKTASAPSRIPIRNIPTLSPQDDAYQVPYKGPVGSPLTARSSQTSDSSFNSVPDFPMPTSAPNYSKTSNPSTQPPKRGVSSHFSQYTNVSPIIEESEGRYSGRSYASSNVIPTSIPNVYFEDGETPSDEEEEVFKQSNPTLYRQASIGKRHKPSLTSIKRDDSRKSPLSPLKPGSGKKETKTLSTSQESLVPKSSKSPTGLGLTASQVELDKYLRDLEKDQSTGAETSTLKQVKRGTLADRVGPRIPPRINVATIKEAENRASLTSLPDLIRRATKLAANLDRGKTASRLGTDWLMYSNRGNFSDLEKDSMGSRPPLVSPDDFGSNPRLRSDDRLGGPMYSPRKRGGGARGRRICGMSRNSFMGIMILLILLVCAAIIIPVALVVIPHGSNGNSVNSSCAKKLPCENGGASMSTADGTCICICINGNSGTTCQTLSDPACTTIAVPNFSKATVGAEVEPLMSSANANYSIPLDDSFLLTQFAKNNISCAAENALVTLPNIPPAPARAVTFAEINSPPSQAKEAVSTPSGILVAPTATEDSGPVMTGIPTGETPATIDISQNSTAIEFGKIGILFVLQDSQAIGVASQAQNKLLGFFVASSKNGSTTLAQTQNVSLDNGYSINLWDGTVTLKNGTIYGDGWNGTATTA